MIRNGLFWIMNLIFDREVKTCSEESLSLGDTSYFGQSMYWWGDAQWYNMSFWGGYTLIASRKNTESVSNCIQKGKTMLFLDDEHPDINVLSEKIVTRHACFLDENEICELSVDIELRKCDGDLMYRFPWRREDSYNRIICFDRVYLQQCDENVFDLSVIEVVNQSLAVSLNSSQYGWFLVPYLGKQYFFPFIEPDATNSVLKTCGNKHIVADSDIWYCSYYIQDEVPALAGEMPVHIRLCRLSGWSTRGGSGIYRLWYNCDINTYIRVCNGELQIDMTWHFRYRHNYNGTLYLAESNFVKVIPEIVHTTQYVTIEGRETTLFSPFLQFRCASLTGDDVPYIVKWYINGVLQQTLGPSNLSEDLVLTNGSFSSSQYGYEVQCGMLLPESEELSSSSFFVGWKISETSIELSKTGFAVVSVEQTVPLGCSYTAHEQPNCIVTLSLTDPERSQDMCNAPLEISNVADSDTEYPEIQTLKMNEVWTGAKKYRFKVSTIDYTYNDLTLFNLELIANGNHGSDVIYHADIEVRVTDDAVNQDSICYSHVDPHMRTADGSYYEQQREGDRMLFRNKKFVTEVQESAKYCYPRRTRGPVCACGIAIRVGADVFMINRCGKYTKLDYTPCGDGGIIDVKRVNDNTYQVRTPTGTLIYIYLHSWSRTMNIDIYLSPKDFGNSDGLCGYFDNNPTNDFLHRDGTISFNDNSDYAFSESWRLSDDENLFLNRKRYLDPWSSIDFVKSHKPCDTPISITRKKCKLGNRKKRDTMFSLTSPDTQDPFSLDTELTRKKRSYLGNMTEADAEVLCADAIYNAPAYTIVPDNLAGEDLSKVVEQCVYDVTQENDTVWIGVHVSAVNNIAKGIINMKPEYAANNVDLLTTFLSDTCVNNCSDNGRCSDEGLCVCNGIYRGPYCNIDISIPPVVYDVEEDEGGLCDTTDSEGCKCFVIRTNNIFDGFQCMIRAIEVFLNGTMKEVASSSEPGKYEDIFTGVCCLAGMRRKRSDDATDIIAYIYEIAVSNDGNTFGNTSTVSVYDSTCLELIQTEEAVSFKLKGGYCFIGGACITAGAVGEECYICNPEREMYEWTTGNCGEKHHGLTTAELIGIIVASVLASVAVICFLVYICICKNSKKKRAIDVVQEINKSNRITTVNGHLRHEYWHAGKGVNGKPFKLDMWTNGSRDTDKAFPLGEKDAVSSPAIISVTEMDADVTPTGNARLELDRGRSVSSVIFEL